MQVGDDDADNMAAQTSAETAAQETADEQTEQQVENTEVEQPEGEGNALTEAAKPQEPVKPKDPVKPFQARIGELTRNWREEERRRMALEAEVAELRRGKQAPAEDEQQEQPQQRQAPGTVPAEMVDRLAETKAAQLDAQRQFDRDCNVAFDKGLAKFEDFNGALKTFGSMVNPDLYVKIVDEALATDAPEDVLHFLGSNPEEIARFAGMPSSKRIAEFTKMTLKAPAKPVVSKVPAPIKPVGGTAKKDFDYADDAADDADWFARRDKDARAAGRI